MGNAKIILEKEGSVTVGYEALGVSFLSNGLVDRAAKYLNARAQRIDRDAAILFTPIK